MSDFEVDIVKGLCEASHFHPELEILFIIEGNATVNVKSRKYELKKDDALLINSNTMHTVESMEHTIIYRVCLSRRFIGKIVRDKNILFDTDKIYEDIGGSLQIHLSLSVHTIFDMQFLRIYLNALFNSCHM